MRKNAISIKNFIPHIPLFFHSYSDIFRQAPFSLLFCSFTGLLAGISLGFMTNTLLLLPGLIVLIPPAIDMGGNIYGALTSRLGTSMHLGLFYPTLKKGGVLYQNAYASLLLTIILSVILGFLAKIVTFAFGMLSIHLFYFILISVIGGLLSGVILLGISLLVSIVGYNRGWDIDNMSSPMITSTGDMVTLPSLYFSAILLLKTPEMVVTTLSLLFIFFAIFCGIKGMKMEDAAVRRIITESIPMLFISGFLSTLAGITLGMNLESLIAIPVFLVIVPTFLGESNGLAGILSARLSSMFHIGTINSKFFSKKLVIANFIVIYIFSALFFPLIGLLSYEASTLLSIGINISTSSPGLGPGLLVILLISLLGGVICATFLNFFSYCIAMLSFKFKIDPDNDTIPLVTSLTDIIGVLCLLFTIYLFL